MSVRDTAVIAAPETRAADGRPELQGVKLLLPVWGRRHLDLFLEASLSSLLWPGNLPALAGALPCEFVVMTGSDEVATLVAHPNWLLLERVCPARIVIIDDLISDASYAVTVTMAYAQAIRATGPAMLDTGFLFLVADFLFADGALAAVLDRLRGGASGVLAGNFQVSAEAVARSWPGGSIAADTPMAPRRLLRWSLDHLHSATRSAIVNESYRRDSSANRLFWRVDGATLLGRFYLLHMIAIRPDVGEFTIGAACDYSFISELCPSGRVEVLSDSDAYFVTELQAGAGLDAAPARALDPRRVAADLSRWTTVRHRDNARHTLVFHAGDVPARLPEIRAEADATIAAIARHLSATPQPHRDHPYWIGGVALRRATTGRGDPVPGWRLRGAATRLWWRMRLSAFGRPPDVRPWHPRWPDFAIARARLRRSGAILILSDEPDSFALWASRFAARSTSLRRAPLDLPAQERQIGAAGPFDHGLVVLPEQEAGDASRLVAVLGPGLKPDGEIIILLIKDLRDDPALLDPAGLAAIECDLHQTGWAMQSSTQSAGPVRRAIQQVLLDTLRTLRGGARPVAILAFFACGVLAFLSFACNQIAVLVPAQRRPVSYSSAVFVLRRSTAEIGRFAAPGSTGG